MNTEWEGLQNEKWQSFKKTKWYKLSGYALLLLITFVPFFMSLFSNKDAEFLLDSYEMISDIKYCFVGNDFWISKRIDFTELCHAMIDDGGRMFYQGIFCLFAEIALFRFTRLNRKKRLYPFTFVYSVYSLCICSANCGDYFLSWGDFESLYNRIMLWGRYVRGLHGLAPIIIHIALVAAFLYYVISERVSDKAVKKEMI